jgi:hypothetical protein
MLKLGDKSLMGIVIPTLLVGLLLAVPYIDRNPSRLFIRRPVAVGIGVLGILVLILLSYMGTPVYGIETPAATRIIQDMSPEEGIGPLQEIPFNQLRTGIYVVNETPTENLCPDLDFGCPRLEEFFGIFSDRVNASIEAEDPQARLSNGEGILLVEEWQENLKKVTLRITWDDLETGEGREYSRNIYIHRNHGEE